MTVNPPVDVATLVAFPRVFWKVPGRGRPLGRSGETQEASAVAQRSGPLAQ